MDIALPEEEKLPVGRKLSDSVVGKPPRGLSREARTEWYAVSSRYKVVPSSRMFLILYMDAWIDAVALERELEGYAVMDRAETKAFVQLRSLRKDSRDCLVKLAADIRMAPKTR